MAHIKSWSNEQGFGYIEHPEHVRLVRDWGPRCTSIRVHDILDESR